MGRKAGIYNISLGEKPPAETIIQDGVRYRISYYSKKLKNGDVRFYKQVKKYPLASFRKHTKPRKKEIYTRQQSRERRQMSQAHKIVDGFFK